MSAAKAKRSSASTGVPQDGAVNGAMTDYIVMPEFLVHHIPAGIPFDVAALAETLGHRRTRGDRMRPVVGCSDIVVITGAGPIGILAAFVAKSCALTR